MIATAAHEFVPVNPPVAPADDESALLARVHAGDIRAFEALYRRHAPRVYATCLRLAADPVRAGEFTQSAFIQAWQRLPSFRGESAFTTWLHRIAVNVALMEFRARGRREARMVPVAEPARLETAPPSRPAGLSVDLEQAIAALPPQARAVFVLHDVEGYTHEEIATQMDLEPGTSKSQLHRARQLLREALR